MGSPIASLGHLGFEEVTPRPSEEWLACVQTALLPQSGACCRHPVLTGVGWPVCTQVSRGQCSSSLGGCVILTKQQGPERGPLLLAAAMEARPAPCL